MSDFQCKPFDGTYGKGHKFAVQSNGSPNCPACGTHYKVAHIFACREIQPDARTAALVDAAREAADCLAGLPPSRHPGIVTEAERALASLRDALQPFETPAEAGEEE